MRTFRLVAADAEQREVDGRFRQAVMEAIAHDHREDGVLALDREVRTDVENE